MCGIAGIVKSGHGGNVNPGRLKRMRDTLRHRGPDDAGILVSGPVGFAHRRLAIIDLPGGRQPMTSFDGRVWITYNGEVYNFRELRAELVARGHEFATQSDTEVVLRSYEVFGEQCVEHLRGMFAFAIWDGPRHRLFLARDRLGIKPLYYTLGGGELLFASEIKALLAAGPGKPAINESVLSEYLATRFVSGPETFFHGVRKLRPGHTLSWSAGSEPREQCYWQLPCATADSSLSLEQHAQTLRLRLEEAIRCHLVSDVPVGLFLSGGIDSSGLAALMAPMLAQPLRTFAVGFADPDADELAFARLVAAGVGAEHREVVVSPAEFFDAVPRLVWHEDEPIAFPSSVPLFFVARLARDHVKVVITGEGADELFLGYNRYRVTVWNERVGRAYHSMVPTAVSGAVSEMVPALPRPLRRYAERTFLARSTGARSLFLENFAVFPEAMQRQLLSDPQRLMARDPYAEALRCYAGAGPLECMSHADLQTYLVELLMKQDQMSMAASIESRVPYLDHEFVSYAMSIPSRYKLRGWRTKAVLRAALRGAVPRSILARRKMGFPVPVGRWLRGAFWPMVEEFVLGPRAMQRGLFMPAGVRQLAGEHHADAAQHGDRLWLLMNFEIWQRIFIDGEDPGVIMHDVSRRTVHASAA